MKKMIAFCTLALLTACNTPFASMPTEIPGTETSSVTPTLPPTETSTPTITLTPTRTLTPTITPTSTITPTFTVTPSPTFAFPTVTVNQQAFCRYGPNKAYYHAADLYAGDTGKVVGRYYPNLSKWLYVRFDKLDYDCWVAPSVVDVVGDVMTLRIVEDLRLESIGSNQYGPPTGVSAVRSGDQVTVSWNMVNMTDDKDRGYFLDVFVCQNGFLIWWPTSLATRFETSYTFTDQAGCSQPSGGDLYTVEKHGYSGPIKIPWPAAP
jgi:hypothetical protein